MPPDISYLPVPIGSLTLDGPDATRFLDGQVTQKITPVPVGESTLAALVSPDGYIISPLRILHRAQDTWELACPTPLMQAVTERLTRFFIRIKATLVATREASLCPIDQASPTLNPLWPLSEELVATTDTPDETAFLLERLLRGASYLPQDGGPRLQVESVPTLTARAVSYNKGCYTGQELVARTHSRGARPPISLVPLTTGDTSLPDQSVIDSKGESAGEITSFATFDHTTYAIAQIKRRFVEGADLYTSTGSPLLPRKPPT